MCNYINCDYPFKKWHGMKNLRRNRKVKHVSREKSYSSLYYFISLHARDPIDKF